MLGTHWADWIELPTVPCSCYAATAVGGLFLNPTGGNTGVWLHIYILEIAMTLKQCRNTMLLSMVAFLI